MSFATIPCAGLCFALSFTVIVGLIGPLLLLPGLNALEELFPGILFDIGLRTLLTIGLHLLLIRWSFQKLLERLRAREFS
jgi:hypothetical protein